MEQTTWAALTVILTILGLAWTAIAFRRRGAINALRALGFTLLPAAAYLTGTLTMFTEIVGSIMDWATNLVFDPQVWTGVALAGAGVGFILLAAYLRDRQLGKVQAIRAADSGKPVKAGKSVKSGKAGKAGGAGAAGPVATDPGSHGSVGTARPATGTGRTSKSTDDPAMEDVEEMLRKRGIE